MASLIAVCRRAFSTTASHTTKVHIPRQTRIDIASILTQASCSPYDYSQFDMLSEHAFSVLDNHLSTKVKKAIVGVNTTPKGFLEITGMPCDPVLESTPMIEGEIEKNKKTFVKELFCMGLQKFLNLEIFNYRQEGWGRGSLIFNIFPRQDMKALKGAGGYENDFRFHMENAWHPRGLRALFLTGIRQDIDKSAITYCVSNKTIVDQLTPLEKKVLQLRNFRISPPEIHRKMETEKGILFTADEDFVGPILTKDRYGYPQLRINFNGMKPNNIDPVAQDVLNRVEKIAIEHTSEIKLSSENMVIINNLRAIHTRNGYIPQFNGLDRWFQRYFLTTSRILWPNNSITINDFTSFLTIKQATVLLNHLSELNIINDSGKLQPIFTPHLSTFTLGLPGELNVFSTDIHKVLIRKGPVQPHRVI